MTPRFSGRRVFWSVFVGILLVQAAWILTVPPFRGSDEFDHVYKIAAVPRGQWSAQGPAVNGRGGIVTIPGSIVRAAGPVCEFYPYTLPDNCRAVKGFSNGDVQVASAASSYNPTYYLVVGALTRPFAGESLVYAARAVSAAFCALLLAWSATLIARWSRTSWPMIVYAVGLTPVFLYSTTVAAPNGLTYAGAVLLWSALIAATKLPDDATGGLAVPAAVGAIVMVTTHTTGSLWLVLITLVTLTMVPFRQWIATLWRSRGRWVTAAAAVFVATLLTAIWVRTNNTNALSAPMTDVKPLTTDLMVSANQLWVLQGIAVFPTRNEQAPPIVYVLWLLALMTVAVLAVRRYDRRLAIASALTVALIIAVPTVLTVLTYSREQITWQGRYTLPLSIGFILLAGAALDRSERPPRKLIVPVLFVMMAIAMTVSAVNVGRVEVDRGPSDPIAAFPGGFVLVGLLAAIGVLLPLVALARTLNDDPPSSVLENVPV